MSMIGTTRLTAFVATVFYALPAGAADIQAISKVDAVTVYLAGAEVTRTAHVAIDKGEHTIVLKDIPAGAVPGSIRVEGKATGKLDIGSVDTARKFLQRAESQAADAERKVLEHEIDRTSDEKSAVEAQVAAAQTQKTLIANLAQLPTRPAPSTGSALGEDWARVLGLIAQGTSDASRIEIEASTKLREIDRKLEDLHKRLSELVPAKTEQTEVRIFVAAASPLEADLTVRYQVANANWVPLYDARLLTGTKTDPAKLELAQRAAITQRTGEAWDNVTLALSTARPSESAAAPVLESQTVDFEPEYKPVAAPAPPPQALRKQRAAREAEQDEMAAAQSADTAALGGLAAAPQAAPIMETAAAVTAAPFEATYAVAGLVSVAANGEAKRVLLGTEKIEPMISSRSVPKIDSNAYVYATFKLASASPFLPGQIYLFRDGTFVGTGSLPLLQPGVDHDLGFGVDDQVKVRYAVLEEKRGETGLISTSRVDSRNFRVSVKNLHERAVDVRLFDRIPVSANDEIKVKLDGPARPAAENVDDKRGVIRFDARLEPDEENVLEYGYQTTWPAAKSITYGP